MVENKSDVYLLIISPYLPSEHSGHAGAQLIFRNVKELAKDHKITIAAFTNKEDKNYIIDLEKNGIDIIDIPYERNPDSILGKMVSFCINWVPMFRSFFGLGIFFISKYNRKSMRKKLEELKFRELPDLVQFEYNVMHHYADIFPNIPKVLIQHDISTKVYERGSALSANWFNKNKRNFQHAKLNENIWMQKFDSIVVLTEEDKKYCEENWDGLPPIKVIPPPISETVVAGEKNHNEICFIGSFNREPNIQSVEAMIQTVFPPLKKKYPDLKLKIAGKYLSEYHINKIGQIEGIEYHGFLQEINSFIGSSILMIAPILMGAGLKMKITQALACGTAVLTTPVGGEGIPLNSDDGLFIENYDGNFLNRAVNLLLNPLELKSSGLKGQKQVQKIFSPEAIGEKFETLYSSLIQS